MTAENRPSTRWRRLSRRAARFRGYVLLVFGTGVTRALAFAAAVVLARALGPTRFGEASVFLTIIGFWASPDFLDSAFVRYASRADARAERDTYLRASLALKLAWNVVLLLLAFPIAWLLSRYVLSKPVLLAPILLAIVCGVGLNMLSLRASMYQAVERFFEFAATTSIFYVLSLVTVVGVVLVAGARSTMSVYVAYLVPSGVVGIYGWWCVRREVRDVAWNRDVARELLLFSRWLFGANLGYMVTQRLDLFLLAGLSSLAAVGQYGAALRVVMVVSLLTGSLAPALLPKASRARTSPTLVRTYLKHGAALSAAIAALVACLWVAAPVVVRVLFGASYAGAVPIVRIILGGTLAIAIYTPLSQLFMRDSRPRKMLYLSVLRFAVVLGLGFPLVSAFGAKGAAAAVSGAELTVLCYVLLVLRGELLSAIRHRDSRGVAAADVESNVAATPAELAR